jgi:hypothetical protein
MASPTATSSTPPRVTAPRSAASRTWRWVAVILAVLVLLCIVAGAILFAKFWPFSEKAVLEDLAEASDSKVAAVHYHATYFPPGCTLDQVEFDHEHSRFITIDKLVVRGSYLGILRHHVPHIEAIGGRVFIPAFGSQTHLQTQHSATIIDELVANGAYVEFESSEPREKPFRFDVHEATLRDVGWGRAIAYHLKFHNPNPPGEISAEGQFGPWVEGHPEETPFSGRYEFDHADLGVYRGIAGTLSSRGQFDGALKHLSVNGTTLTPDFEVTASGHKVKLETKFDAYVNGMNGDTFLKRVDAHFRRTNLVAEGSVAHSPGQKGKVTDLQITTRNGRIEDLLGLFVSEPRAPMSGFVSLHTKALIPPGDEEFLKKVQLDGGFGIDEGSFSKPETQKDVDQLSAGARGENKEDPETVLTDLLGQVKVKDGTTHFTDLSFGIPGAKARMHGTYNLLNYRIDLHGRMQVDTKISKTTSGMKSFLLKMMDPFFKKKKKGEVVPVHILGTYHKPQFGLDFSDNDDSTKGKDDSKKK